VTAGEAHASEVHARAPLREPPITVRQTFCSVAVSPSCAAALLRRAAPLSGELVRPCASAFSPQHSHRLAVRWFKHVLSAALHPQLTSWLGFARLCSVFLLNGTIKQAPPLSKRPCSNCRALLPRPRPSRAGCWRSNPEPARRSCRSSCMCVCVCVQTALGLCTLGC
jgi:hypothetical protein